MTIWQFLLTVYDTGSPNRVLLDVGVNVNMRYSLLKLEKNSMRKQHHVSK